MRSRNQPVILNTEPLYGPREADQRIRHFAQLGDSIEWKKAIIDMALLYSAAHPKAASIKASPYLQTYKNPLEKTFNSYMISCSYDEISYEEMIKYTYEEKVRLCMLNGTIIDAADVGLLLLDKKLHEFVDWQQKDASKFFGYIMGGLPKKEQQNCYEVAQQLSPFELEGIIEPTLSSREIEAILEKEARIEEEFLEWELEQRIKSILIEEPKPDSVYQLC